MKEKFWKSYYVTYRAVYQSFFISMWLKVDTDSYYSQKMEECTFKNTLIGFLPYYWLIGFATRWFQNTRFYQSPILTLLGFAFN